MACCLAAAGLLAALAGASSGDPDIALPSASGDAPPVGLHGAVDDVTVSGGTATVQGWVAPELGATAQVLLSFDTDPAVAFPVEEERFDAQVALGSARSVSGFTATRAVPPGAVNLCVDLAIDGRVDQPIRLRCVTVDPAESDRRHDDLQALVNDLATSAENGIAGYQVSIAVLPLDTERVAGHRERELFISASTAKAWWTAAAMANGERAEAEVLAEPVFAESSNTAAGTMIDLAGDIDDVNDYTAGLGMGDTAAVRWSANRVSTTFPGRLGGSNHTTATDAVRFGRLLATNQALAPSLSAELAEWMRASPRTDADSPPEWPGVASMLTDRLPPAVRDLVSHKAGWLDPSEDYSVPLHLLDIGIVWPAGDSPGYAVALFGRGTSTSGYDRLIQWMEYASCEIYRLEFDADGWDCGSW